MIRNFTEDTDDISSVTGHEMAMQLLERVRDNLVKFQEETGHLYNLEATPAEGACYRFAREDKKRFPDIIQAGFEDAPYYTNSSMLPVGYTEDPFEALEWGDLQSMYTGGTVLHLYMGERVSTPPPAAAGTPVAYRLPRSYITITPTFSISPKYGYLSGEHQYPKCQADHDAEVAAAKAAETAGKPVKKTAAN